MADLEALKLKRDQLNARIQKAEALNKASETKADNRVKVLVGAAVLDQIKRTSHGEAELLALLANFLARESERVAVLGDDRQGSESFKRLTRA